MDKILNDIIGVLESSYNEDSTCNLIVKKLKEDKKITQNEKTYLKEKFSYKKSGIYDAIEEHERYGIKSKANHAAAEALKKVLQMNEDQLRFIEQLDVE